MKDKEEKNDRDFFFFFLVCVVLFCNEMRFFFRWRENVLRGMLVGCAAKVEVATGKILREKLRFFQ